MTPKEGGPHGDQAGQCPPTDTLAITYYVFQRPEDAGPSPKVTDIFMLREITPDEAGRKLGAGPGARPAHTARRVLEAIPLDALAFASAASHDPERAAKHATAAEAVNEAWRTGDATGALPHLAAGVRYINALYGTSTTGPDAWAAMLAKNFARYTLLWHSSATCVTPGNKAFVFFTAAAKWARPSGGGGDGGEEEGAEVEEGGPTIYEFVQPSGCSLLLFDDDDKASTIISFFTPLPGQRGRLVAAAAAEGAGVKDAEGVQAQGEEGPVEAEEGGAGAEARAEPGKAAAGEGTAAAEEEVRAAEA